MSSLGCFLYNYVHIYYQKHLANNIAQTLNALNLIYFAAHLDPLKISDKYYIWN